MTLNRVPEKLIGDGLGLATQAELDAQGAAKTTEISNHSNAKTGVHGVGAGYSVARTSRADQLPDWTDIASKPASYTPSAHKTTHATGGTDALSPADIGAETPTAAQTKATTAETNAKGYADTVSATAESNAKTYADGKAATAETNAKGYADTVAATAENNAKTYADGKAATAESNAKGYTDTKITTRFVAVPASATAAGNPGDWSADANYLYVCHAANTWKRVAIATW